MLLGSHRGSIGDVMRWRGLRIVVVLLCVAVLPFALKLYAVQELFIAVLGVALAFIALMPLLVAFLLVQGGVRRALPWLKTNVARVAAWSHTQLWANRLRARF
jgi:hypothetical protein